jgi:hypothetical protein
VIVDHFEKADFSILIRSSYKETRATTFSNNVLEWKDHFEKVNFLSNIFFIRVRFLHSRLQ